MAQRKILDVFSFEQIQFHLIHFTGCRNLSMKHDNIHFTLLCRQLFIKSCCIRLGNFNSGYCYIIINKRRPLIRKGLEILRNILIHKGMCLIVMVSADIKIIDLWCTAHSIQNAFYRALGNALPVKKVARNQYQSNLLLFSILCHSPERLQDFSISSPCLF